MSLITDNFKKVADEKNLKFNAKDIERTLTDNKGEEVPHKQVVLQTALQVSDDKVVPSAVVLHDTDDLEYINYQMTYNRIGLVTDRNKISEILEKINEINSLKSGYYHFIVNPDGELIMRHLGIMGADAVPAVSTFIHGGRILRSIMPELAELDGIDLSTRLD